MVMAIHRYLDLSTGFVTQSDMELLGGSPYCIASYDHGVFLSLPQNTGDEAWRFELREEIGMSERFIALLDYAAGIGVDYVRLDSDGDQAVEGLTFYGDW